MIITKKSVYRHLIEPLKYQNIKLIGSIHQIGYSNKDIDLLLTLSKYPVCEEEFLNFQTQLYELGWNYEFTDVLENYGVVHNYSKRGISLDVFINEKNKGQNDI